MAVTPCAMSKFATRDGTCHGSFLNQQCHFCPHFHLEHVKTKPHGYHPHSVTTRFSLILKRDNPMSPQSCGRVPVCVQVLQFCQILSQNPMFWPRDLIVKSVTLRGGIMTGTARKIRKFMTAMGSQCCNACK